MQKCAVAALAILLTTIACGKKDGELNALVAKRFLMTIEGRNVEDAKFLHQIASKIDMAKLATLK